MTMTLGLIPILMYQGSLQKYRLSLQQYGQTQLRLQKELLTKTQEFKSNMDILIPLVVISAILLVSIRKFKPQVWKKIVAKFKK
jgi:hypothetical protein